MPENSRISVVLLAAWLAVVGSGPLPGAHAAQADPTEDAPGQKVVPAPENSAQEQKEPANAEAPTPAPTTEELVAEEKASGVLVLESVSGSGEVSMALAETLRFSTSGQGRAARHEGLVVGENTIPLEDMLFLRFPGESTRQAPFTLFLREGGELSGRVVGGDENSVHFHCSGWLPATGQEGKESPQPESIFKIPLESVKGILALGKAPGARQGFKGATARTRSHTAANGRLRKTILTADPEHDVVILLGGGREAGVLETLEGGGIRFSSDGLGDSVLITYNQLRAIVLADLGDTPEAQPEGSEKKDGEARSRARLTLRDGSRFVARLLRLESGNLSVSRTDLGILSIALTEVLEVAFLDGRSSYLSDREPLRTKEHLGPAFVLTRPFRRDTNVLGAPMRMAGREYKKGLGVHSYSLLEYTLDGEFSRFLAWVGLDESARPTDPGTLNTDVGSVVFRVLLDGKPVLEKPMTWRDPPVQLEVPISGGNVLGLEVDYGGRAGSTNFARDRANWAESIVIK